MASNRTFLSIAALAVLAVTPVSAHSDEKIIGGDFDASWDAAVTALSERGVPIIFADQSEGTIRAQSAPAPEAPPGARFRYREQPASRGGISIKLQRFSDNRTGVTIECKEPDSGVASECDEDVIRALRDRISATVNRTASIIRVDPADIR